MKELSNALCVLALSVTSAFGGVVFEVETTDFLQSPPVTEKQHIRVDGQGLTVPTPKTEEQGGGVMIFRGDRGPNGEMIVVDHDRKGYFVMDDAAVLDMASRITSAMSQMQEMLKNLPEEQRRATEEMIKKRGGLPVGDGADRPEPVVEIRATGKSDVVNNYPCAKYEVFRDGKKIRELCNAEWANIEGGSEAAGAFARMGEFAKRLREAFSQFPVDDQSPVPYNEMNFEAGFPVYTASLDEDGEIQEDWQLKSSRRQALDPAEFEPPAGYERIDMSGL